MQQRLGMVLALLGKYEQAREMLHDVAPALGEWSTEPLHRVCERQGLESVRNSLQCSYQLGCSFL